MNKTYRTFWNPLLQRVVVTHEASKTGAAMRSVSVVVGTLLALSSSVALAADNVIGTSSSQGGVTSSDNTLASDTNQNIGDTWVSAGDGNAVVLATTPTTAGSNTVGALYSKQIASFSATAGTYINGYNGDSAVSTLFIGSSGVQVTNGEFQALHGATIVGATSINASGSDTTTIGNAVGGDITIQSAGTTTLTATTNNIVGSTNNLGVASSSTNNIGTSGANNNIGSSASTNTIQGTTTLTGATTVTGTANINTAGTANTSIGNATGTVAMIGSTVGVGTNSASVVNVGSTSGNSTLNFNNNRLQNVGNAVLGTDAVNLNQLNSAINGIQNQVNTNKAGIAGVTAATNLPGLSAGQKYNFGVAWGNYQAYNGLAIGGHARVTDNVTLKVSGSGTSGVYSGGAGLAIGF